MRRPITWASARSGRRSFAATARHFRVPIVYVNQVGGNDQLLFDGTSFAMNPEGQIIACAASFEEDLVLVDTATLTGERHDNFPDECEAVYQALAMGTRDYIRKCGFERVIIGLSGGIDSALTAAIAVDAVGKENVIGVGMPGPYSSEHSVTRCARSGSQPRHPVRADPDQEPIPRVSQCAGAAVRWTNQWRWA